MMKYKKFSIELYHHVLFLFCPCDAESIQKWARRKGIAEELDLSDFDNCEAITISSSHGNLVFMHNWEDTPEGLGTLTHELCHVTFNVLNERGVKEEAGNEEAAAYLLESLVAKSVKWLRSTKKLCQPNCPNPDNRAKEVECASPLPTD